MPKFKYPSIAKARLLNFLVLPLLFVLLFAVPAGAQTLENKFFGDKIGADLLPEHLIALSDGSAVITGKTNTLDTGGYHVLLIRTDSFGNTLWQRTYHQGSGTWVSKALDGGFIVGGTADRPNSESQQGFILKVNESGVVAWDQYISLGDDTYVNFITSLNSGNIAVCGFLTNSGPNPEKHVFWAIFDENGSLVHYEIEDSPDDSYAPKMTEAKNGNLILGWSTGSDDWLRCFTPAGQTVWEHDLTAEFDYKFGYAKGLLVDATGDLWIAGGFRRSINHADFQYQVLKFSSIGNLIHRINYEDAAIDPVALYPTQNGRVNLWLPRIETGSYSKLTLSNQGTIVARDSVVFNTFQRIKSLAEIDENHLLMLDATPFEKNSIRVQPIQKSGPVYQPLDPWVFSSGRPYSHELYEAHCASLSGGEFILTRGEARSGKLLDLGYYVLRTNQVDQELAWTYLGDGPSVRNGQILPTQDGGALALGANGLVWKVNAEDRLVWTKQAKRGQLYTGTKNDFFIVESSTQPSPFDPILIYHYDPNGDSITVNKVYSRSQDYYLAGGISQLNNGPVLFGNKYEKSDQSWHNWIIYLDKQGEFVSEIVLGNEYPPSSYSAKAIRTSDGGALLASYYTADSIQGIYLMHLKNGRVLWDYTLRGQSPDSVRMDLLSIEEIPCKGFLVAFDANKQNSNTLSNKITVLHSLDENGQGKDFFSYKPLLGAFAPNPHFLPGYTYRHWGYQWNQQTYDILLQTIHFQDTSSVLIPADKLAIMPNPSSEEICLHYESASFGILEVAIFNEAGQRLDQFKSEKTAPLWLFHYRAHYHAGTYFIQIKNGQGAQVVQRWVKS